MPQGCWEQCPWFQNQSLHSQVACLSRGRDRAAPENAGVDLVCAAPVSPAGVHPACRRTGAMSISLPIIGSLTPSIGPATKTPCTQVEKYMVNSMGHRGVIIPVAPPPEAHPGPRGSRPLLLELRFGIRFSFWFNSSMAHDLTVLQMCGRSYRHHSYPVLQKLPPSKFLHVQVTWSSWFPFLSRQNTQSWFGDPTGSVKLLKRQKKFLTNWQSQKINSQMPCNSLTGPLGH